MIRRSFGFIILLVWLAGCTSPGTETGNPVKQTVVTPVFSVSGGSYATVQSVLITTTTAQAEIRYTTDGITEPTVTSVLFDVGKPIVVDKTMTLKAKAFKAGLNESAIITVEYSIYADKTEALAQAKATAKSMTETDYTSASWAAFIAALETAKALPETVETEVTAKTAAYNNSVLVLITQTAKVAFDTVKEEVEALKEADYSPASWATFTAALETAKALPETVEAEVTAKTTAFENAFVLIVKQFTVIFDVDGATTTATPISKTVTSPTTKVDGLPVAPAKTGFYFGGWFTEKNGTGTEFTATTVVTASITVYAKWTAVPVFTVSFDTDSGSAVTSQSIAENSKATRPATNPTKSGYIFNNWYTDSGKTTVYDFNTAVTAIKTIYAKWTPDTYTVTFDGDAATTASNPTSKTVTSPATKVDELPDAPAKTGFYFGGWFTAKNGAGTEFTATTVVTASITVYAKWTAVPVFTVSFNTDSGSAVASQSIAENSKATRPATNPTKSGYTFDNWYADSGKTTVYDFNTAVTSAKTIYAKWTANMYTVTFDGDGATTEAVSATKTVVSPATTVVTLPTAPVKTGYTFAGWYTDKNGAGTEFTATTVVTGDVKVYAKWNSYSYTVTFDGDYATKTVATPATTVVTLPTAPAKTGYTFAGWYTEENGEGTEFTAASVVTGDVKVYAKLTINQYTVTYNSNNATGGTVPDVQTQNYNSSITVRSNSGILVYLPENAESRKFGGWNTKADGTGVNYLVGSGGFTLTEDIILYVKWGVFNLRDTGPAGGLIFYDKGVYSDGWRYLESWTEDEAGCYFNSNVIIDLTVVTSTAIGTGYANTYNAMEGAEYVAAEVVRNATHGGKNDWFMPSLDELNQMCWVLHSKGWPNVNNPAYGTNQVGGFRDTFYWSSSIEDKATVWYISFSDGDQRYTDCRGLYLPVRAVRAF